MIHRLRRPGPPLGSYVDVLWVWVDDAPLGHGRERLLPTGQMGFVVNLGEDAIRTWDDEGAPSRFDGTIVAGAWAKHTVLDVTGPRDVAGVHFKPGGASAFLGVPAGDVEDRDAPLTDLWGRAAGRLRERLLEARDADARLDVLETVLLERLSRSKRRDRHPAVAWALAEVDRRPDAATIANLTARLGIDRRRFLTLFRDEVGLGPKRYARVRRFQEVMGRAEGRHVEWADVALSCGYFDQAHLIRDFRAFSGLTPLAWMAQRAEHRNHVPIQD